MPKILRFSHRAFLKLLLLFFNSSTLLWAQVTETFDEIAVENVDELELRIPAPTVISEETRKIIFYLLEKCAKFPSFEWETSGKAKWVKAAEKAFSAQTLVEIETLYKEIEAKIGEEDLVKRIRNAPGLFGDLKINHFREFVRLYEEASYVGSEGTRHYYLGPEGVKERLRKSFNGFILTYEPQEGLEHRFWELIRILRNYLSDEEISQRMHNQLSFFSDRNPQRVSEGIAVVAKYLSREQMINRMRSELDSFARIKVDKFNEVLNIFKAFLNDNEIVERMMSNLLALVNMDPAELKKVITLLESYLTHDEIAARMKADLRGFAAAKALELQKVINLLLVEKDGNGKIINGYLNEIQVKNLLNAGLQGFAYAKENKMKALLSELKKHLSYEEVQELLAKSFESFYLIDDKKLRRILMTLPEDERVPALKHVFYIIARSDADGKDEILEALARRRRSPSKALSCADLALETLTGIL